MDNTWAKGNEEQAEEFSKHLQNTFSPYEINNSIPRWQTNKEVENASNTTDKRCTILSTTAQEVTNLIKATKTSKAPGFHLINGKILKNLTPKAIRLTTIIFNAILRIQYFPALWKIAQTVMLPKPNKNSHLTASYRPISLIPAFFKLLEKIIYNRLKPTIEKEKLIPNHQFGFRNKHSIIEQMHGLVNEILQAQETKQYCTALFMDIEKVFDKVNHEKLLRTIRKQFPEQIYNLLKSHLNNRNFVVKINDAYSEIKDIKAGIPQGSVLGPILYTLYTADISTSVYSKILAFAFDTATLVRHANSETAVALLQEHITKIEKWLQNKQVKVASKLRKGKTPDIQLNGAHIAQTKQGKYLGIHLDTHLTWKHRIKSIINSIHGKRKQMYWLTNKKSKLSIMNKLNISNQSGYTESHYGGRQQ